MGENLVREGAVGGHQWTLVSPRTRRVKNNAENREWTEPQQRQSSGKGGHVGVPWNRDTSVVTYYFTNFSTSFGPEALWKMFLKWGKVVDVFIPMKRNKEGKAFGFVRFKEVAYPQELERRLDQIWIGTYKLRANCIKIFRKKEQPATNVHCEYE